MTEAGKTFLPFLEQIHQWGVTHLVKQSVLDALRRSSRFIRSTKTRTGLSVTAHLDRRNYPTEQLHAMQMKPHDTLPRWNYTVSPNL